MVLDHCGPRRLPNAKNKTTEDAAKAWMKGLLDNDRGAEAITTAIMVVWYAMTCHEKCPHCGECVIVSTTSTSEEKRE